MDKELAESWWLKIKGRTGLGDIVVGLCYRPPKKNKQMKPSTDS